MMNTEGETIRVLLNWIIPASLVATVIKLATKMLAKDVTVTGAILTTIISMLMGIIVGSVVYLAFSVPDSEENVDAIWKAIVATSFSSIVSDRLSHWFVYGFEIDKAMNAIVKIVLNKIKKFIG